MPIFPVSVDPQSAAFEKVALPYLEDYDPINWDLIVSNSGYLTDVQIPAVSLDRLVSLGGLDVYNYFHGAGSLMDYLGHKGLSFDDVLEPGLPFKAKLNIFPFLAYHRIVDKYYKNSLVQCKAFSEFNQTINNNPPSPEAASLGMLDLGSLPYVVTTNGGLDLADYAFRLFDPLYDGVMLGELRQRNFGTDYFTAATPTPQLGDAPLLTMSVEEGQSSFSIAALRAINSMTMFVERNNLSGTDFDRWLESRGGKPLRETTEPVYLGRQVITMYSNAVTQDSNATGAETTNPFESVGARYGLASAVGEDTLIDDFEVEQPGYIMVLCSLVPKASYSSGSRRYLRHFTEEGCRADLADHLLEPIGPQPIYASELDSRLMYEVITDGGDVFFSAKDAVFGYIDRYAEFKSMEDEIHGLMRDGESLESFALQRSFAGRYDNNTLPVIGNDFLQIPINYLDQVAAVDGDISKFGFWADFFFDYRKVQPLGRYTVPSLIDPAVFDGRTVMLDRPNKTL